MSKPASKAIAIRVCKLASDLVATITLMKNAPVKSAVIESPERCRAPLPVFEVARILVRLDHVVRFMEKEW